ncbi:MAG: aminotransferase class I/II-fold pyridoxal phosphate-dependent enzyme [Nitrospinaceae bacterium]|nr:pyridoxal phosphate-dependent aminotransferase family protein [Nitrospinaceae bacterium]NIR54339.1 pyridoxal phosphate-dependent aminotransferase family protein [Nitrospinaceae bacterium]NIS84757.1 pyridoxal phosphate-dependent aminotransferase family protein [Nitrospinaceae bacterium]NIT81558.1 pyridoxal phosphate-dependent aminotransferase family protein [Nitrospinaceae bacterium]NIU43843.1 pyridoxal phosphate-dependent aminotransferase family protein [Nitrospinaceae bacterium]
MTHPFHLRLQKELELRRQTDLRRSIQIQDACRLNLVSNDYFQLRSHPEVLAGAREALEQYGASSSASPLLSGFLPCHEHLIQQLKSWKNKKAGLLFNTGFMANQALITHLPGPNDLVLVDRLIHHSIAQALGKTSARFKRYRHLNLGHLEELLAENHQAYESLFVITESVFSMDGDYPDLPELAALKSKYPFVWILDEAHATGVFGPTGGGLAEETGVLAEVDILMGTLGKALASMGAYILTDSQNIMDYLVNYSGELIYSTYLGPPQVGAAQAALNVIQNSRQTAEQIRHTAGLFRRKLKAEGWPSKDFDSQIVPLILGKPREALELRDKLLEHGILTGAVRPPTVPKDSSRLRFSFHSGVTEDHVNEIVEILKAWRRR